MRRTIAAAVAAAALAATPAVAPAAAPHRLAPTASIAKHCHSGYTRARIGGEIKCLHAGEYCANRYRRQYRRYGYVCRRLHGVWRLR